jgi:hypothetical protein
VRPYAGREFFCKRCGLFCGQAAGQQRMASSIRCRSIGWIAENMKNNQNSSPIDMELSFWHETSCPSLGIEAEHAFVRVVDAVTLLGPDQERAKCESRYEPSDMGPPCDVSARRW